MARELVDSKAVVQRIPEPRAEYIKISGTIDKSFSLMELADISRATVIDLGEIENITSQGVQRWTEFIRSVPSGTPLVLVNVPPPFAAQVEYVPNFTGAAELLTLVATSKCMGCDKEQLAVFDFMNYTSGSQLLDRCGSCGAVMVAVDLNLQQLAPKRVRTLDPNIAALLDKLGIYRRSAPTAAPFEIQKLIEGNANLLRMSGTFDEKFRWQRLLDGLEGTLLLETSQLEVPHHLRRVFGHVLTHAAKVCAPVILVDVPSNVLKPIAEQQESLTAVTIHSVLAACYCASCDEIRQLTLKSQNLLSEDAKGSCPRCGREAPLIAGMIDRDRLRPLLRETPPELMSVIARFEELFSAAVVEAKLTVPGNGSGAQPATAAPQKIGPYRIVRSIARGGMADVFLAVREDFSKPMALKLLRREVLSQARVSLSMFLREARLTSRLNHPNIVQVFDVNESEGNLYIVMEYLEGHAVWRVLSHHNGPFPVPIALRIIGQVLRALQHAHTARDSEGKPLSIVHRDVSPSNILIGTDGNVKLIDFGIALAGTTPDVMAGNPAWMSPEQYTGGALDGRSDLFSVATVLHELLTGKQLFTGAKVQEIGLGVLSAPIAMPKDVSPSLARVLERAHQRSADARFQSAAEFADALRAVADDNGGEASEHDVRTFVMQVMSAPPRPSTPSKSHDLALCETPLSGPNQIQAALDGANRAAEAAGAPPVNVSIDPTSGKPVSTPPLVAGALHVSTPPTPTSSPPTAANANANALVPPPSRAIYALVFLLLFGVAFGAVALFTLRH